MNDWIFSMYGYSRALLIIFSENSETSTFDLNSISSDMIFDIFQDFSGNIWITTEEGVSYFDPLKQNFSLVTNNIGGKQKLDDKNIWTIYEENDSIVWVGTRKGLSKINLLSKIFRVKGIIRRTPIKSVAKPGSIKRSAAKARVAPEIIS
mgnify:CR=1 FL=1